MFDTNLDLLILGWNIIQLCTLKEKLELICFTFLFDELKK